MTRIREGDMVRVRSPKPEWRDMHPDFTSTMDKYVGHLLKVVKIVRTFGGEKRIYLEGTLGVTSYQWRPEWLEPSSSNTIQNGDLL